MRPWKRMRNSRGTAKPCKPACKRQDEDALDLRPRRHPAGDTAAGLRPHQSSSVTVNGLEWNGMGTRPDNCSMCKRVERMRVREG